MRYVKKFDPTVRHKWFAWHPVQVSYWPVQWAWLETVYRRARWRTWPNDWEYDFVDATEENDDA